jgi:hypothetical protein
VRKLLLIILLFTFGQAHSIAFMNEELLNYTYRGIEYECVFFSKHSEPPILYDARDHILCGDQIINPFDNVFGIETEWRALFYIEDNEITYL